MLHTISVKQCVYSKDETGVAAWVEAVGVSFTKWQVTQLRQNPFIMATVSSVNQTVASPARWWC